MESERPSEKKEIQTLKSIEELLSDSQVPPLAIRQLLHAFITGQDDLPATEDPDKLAIMRALIASLDDGIDKQLTPEEIKAHTLETLEELKRHFEEKM